MQSEAVKLFLDFVDESRTLYSQSMEEMKKRGEETAGLSPPDRI